MFSPNVTELPRSLEPISRDTFVETTRFAIGPAAVDTPRAVRANVTQLRPGVSARGVVRAAA